MKSKSVLSVVLGCFLTYSALGQSLVVKDVDLVPSSLLLISESPNQVFAGDFSLKMNLTVKHQEFPAPFNDLRWIAHNRKDAGRAGLAILFHRISAASSFFVVRFKASDNDPELAMSTEPEFIEYGMEYLVEADFDWDPVAQEITGRLWLDGELVDTATVPVAAPMIKDMAGIAVGEVPALGVGDPFRGSFRELTLSQGLLE